MRPCGKSVLGAMGEIKHSFDMAPILPKSAFLGWARREVKKRCGMPWMLLVAQDGRTVSAASALPLLG